MFAPDAARNADGGCGAETAVVDAGEAEARVWGDEGEVAGRNHLQTCGGGDPVDHGDCGFGEIGQFLHHVGAGCEQVGEELFAVIWSVAVARDFFEVMACAEYFPLAVKDDNVCVWVCGGLAKGVADRLDHRGRERMGRGRAKVEGGDVVLGCCSDEGVGHGVASVVGGEFGGLRGRWQGSGSWGDGHGGRRAGFIPSMLTAR
ncbi:MAG: hypothetical protein ACI9PU_002502 [Ascidiaceihabitans sp.]|jgi:hypothetical protein